MIDISIVERAYYNFLQTVFNIANPVKKSIIKTQCLTHSLINIDALNILYNDKYLKEYEFFSKCISDLNKGAIWADKDFKSSNHFYNPTKEKGLYGRGDAKQLAMDYYTRSIELWGDENYTKSIFYFGAVLHLIQDMTIPQHANIRLLDNHCQYETYIKRTYQYSDEFKIEKGAYLLKKIEDYIEFNASVVLRVYRKFNTIKDDEERFFKIARYALPLAKRTTAGAMVLFYKSMDCFKL